MNRYFCCAIKSNQVVKFRLRSGPSREERESIKPQIKQVVLERFKGFFSINAVHFWKSFNSKNFRLITELNHLIVNFNSIVKSSDKAVVFYQLNNLVAASFICAMVTWSKKWICSCEKWSNEVISSKFCWKLLKITIFWIISDGLKTNIWQ